MQRVVPAVPAGIRFSTHYFSEPVPLARWWQPRGVGLYVILIPDFSWGPRPFQPVFVGEFGTEAALTPDEYLAWFRVAAGRDLYIAAAHASSPRPIKEELVAVYRPLCNRGPAPDPSLSQRVDSLEKRDREHDAFLRIVLAAMGRLLEPPPEPRKRSFGFHRHEHSEKQPTSAVTASGK